MTGDRSADDRSRWDERHRGAPPAVVGPPDGLGSLPALSGGRALDVACGRGGQAVWAARAGFDVVALDVSPVAIEATRSLAESNDVGARVDARVHDLTAGLPADLGRFDLVICQRYRDPALWPELRGALRPGGRLAISVLSVVGAEHRGRFHARAGELVEAFAGLDVERSVEADGVAQLVATLPPMDAKLRAVLDELQATISRAEADDKIDRDERAELRDVLGRLDDLLATPDGDHEGVSEQLERAAVRFEGNHPTLAAVIRSAVDTLTGYGI